MSYTPINCNYYDKLEAYATLKTTLTIVYNAENEHTTLTGVSIINLYTKNHEEFLVLNTSLQIRLDMLISINGEAIPKAC